MQYSETIARSDQRLGLVVMRRYVRGAVIVTVMITVIQIGSEYRFAKGLDSTSFLVLELVQIVYGASVSSARHTIFANGLKYHALMETLLETAILTSIALLFRHWTTTSAADAGVATLVLYCSFEEAFAAEKARIRFTLLHETACV